MRWPGSLLRFYYRRRKRSGGGGCSKPLGIDREAAVGYFRVSRTIRRIGKLANMKVASDPMTGYVEYDLADLNHCPAKDLGK
jgi:hypothetical protein